MEGSWRRSEALRGPQRPSEAPEASVGPCGLVEPRDPPGRLVRHVDQKTPPMAVVFGLRCPTAGSGMSHHRRANPFLRPRRRPSRRIGLAARRAAEQQEGL